jgi:protein arginine kinase activator
MVICGHCNKQPALVHLAEAGDRDGEKTWSFRHLCDGCAREMGLPSAKLLDPLAIFQGPFQLLASKELDIACPQCALKLSDFRRSGRVGCEKCYDAFHDILKEVLEKAHTGKTKHVGRGPGPVGEATGRREDLAALQRRLRAAIESESYEEAARLRDRIRSLEAEAG